MSDAFAQCVTTCKEAAANMDLSGDWKPNPGEYMFALTNVSSGADEKGIAWVRSNFRILDGDLKGREFSDYFYLDPSAKGTMGLRNLALLSTCVAGSEVRDPSQCRKVLQDNIGAVLVGEVKRQANKKPGPGKPAFYDRISYTRRIPTSS